MIVHRTFGIELVDGTLAGDPAGSGAEPGDLEAVRGLYRETGPSPAAGAVYSENGKIR